MAERLSIPVDEKLAGDLEKLFPWGTKAAVIRKVLTLLVEQIKRDGVVVIDLLLNDKYNPLPQLKGEKNDA